MRDVPAEGRIELVVTFDSLRYAAAIEKCASKFAARWPNARARPPLRVAPVRPSGTSRHPRRHRCTSDVAMLVGGEIVRDCPADRASCEADLAGCPIACGAASARALQTGLSACFDTAEQIAPCAGTGQDAETRSGLLRLFTDNGDGTITDVRTGLVWGCHVMRPCTTSDSDTMDERRHGEDRRSIRCRVSRALRSATAEPHGLWSLVDLGAPHALAPSAFDTDCAPGCTPGACGLAASSMDVDQRGFFVFRLEGGFRRRPVDARSEERLVGGRAVRGGLRWHAQTYVGDGRLRIDGRVVDGASCHRPVDGVPEPQERDCRALRAVPPAGRRQARG